MGVKEALMTWPLYSGLLLPLLRLCATMCVGLLVASLLEGLHWTRFVAKLAAPLARAGHLGKTPAAAFALAFFSPAASNSLLAEAESRGEINRRELIFANLFNSSPAFLVHLPTMFSLVFAFLGVKAFIYAGLTFAAAGLRTLATVVAGRLLLPIPENDQCGACPDYGQKKSRSETIALTVRRFKKRFKKLLIFTVPVYCLFFALQQAGVFAATEKWLATHSSGLSFLDPKAVSIVALSLAAESGAAFSAAAALAGSGSLDSHQIILALLVGSIVSAPMRAIRHQLPAYAGYFAPGMALHLVVANQICRAASLALIAALYYFYAF